MKTRCQSCGYLILSKYDKGTNKDGTRTEEYCSSCYKYGELYQNGNGMSRQADMLLPFAASLGLGTGMTGGMANVTAMGADGHAAYVPSVFFDWNQGLE